MKKIILILAGLAIYQNWSKIEPFVQDTVLHNKPVEDQTSTLAQQPEVILYATSWCGYCKQTRAFLDEQNISYTEYDIETSDEGRKQHAALGGGGVPVLQIGESVIHGYNKVAVLDAVKRAHD
jgi:glutaredoxin